MEICHLPGRLPAIPLRFLVIGESLPVKITLTSPFRTYALSSDCRRETGTIASVSPNRMFMLGMGFVGQFFGEELKNQGWIVSGTCTSDSKRQQLEVMGYNAYVFDANVPKLEVLDVLKYHTHMLISIPPLEGAGDPMFQHGELPRCRLHNGTLRWICYLSSTSIYGDCGGGWIDEDYEVSPSTELAKGRLMAEKQWLNLGNDLGIPVKIFRLGGIYGPGRSAVDTIIKQGTLSERQRKRLYRKHTSRAHVADICQALNASIHEPSPWKIFNIVDDDPAPRIEVFKYAWDLVEKKWPGKVKPPKQSDGKEASFQKEMPMDEKRVSNARMKKELKLRLLHPSYQSGLESIIEQMDDTVLDK